MIGALVFLIWAVINAFVGFAALAAGLVWFLFYGDDSLDYGLSIGYGWDNAEDDVALPILLGVFGGLTGLFAIYSWFRCCIHTNFCTLTSPRCKQDLSPTIKRRLTSLSNLLFVLFSFLLAGYFILLVDARDDSTPNIVLQDAVLGLAVASGFMGIAWGVADTWVDWPYKEEKKKAVE